MGFAITTKIGKILTLPNYSLFHISEENEYLLSHFITCNAQNPYLYKL